MVKRKHRRNYLLESFGISMVILLMLSLPILGERFSMQVYNLSSATTSSFNAPVQGLYHRLTWVPQATVSTCSVELDGSLDGSSWSTVVASQNCTTAGFATSTAVTTRYLRINVTALAGGQLIVGYSAYDTDPAASGGPTQISVTSGTINQMPSMSVTSGTLNQLPSVSVTSGTLNSLPAINVGTLPTVNVGTLPTVNVGTMPTLSVTSGTINQLPTVNVGTMPRLSVTSGTIGNTLTAQITNTTTTLPVSIRCEDTTGTVFQPCGPTAISVTSGTIGSITMPSLTVTSATVGQMPTLSVTSGTIGQMPTLSVTSGTIGQMPTLSVTSGTIGSTPITTLISRTDTTSSTAAGSAVSQYGDKQGRTVIIWYAPDDMALTTSGTLTATTASAIIAAQGTGYKICVDGWNVVKTSTAATRIDLLFGTTAKDSFAWTQTSNVGENDNPPSHQWRVPLCAPANTAINIQLATAVTDVRAVVVAHKSTTQ